MTTYTESLLSKVQALRTDLDYPLESDDALMAKALDLGLRQMRDELVREKLWTDAAKKKQAGLPDKWPFPTNVEEAIV